MQDDNRAVPESLANGAGVPRLAMAVQPIDFRAAYRAFWLMQEMQAAMDRWFWMMGSIEEPNR